MGMAVMSKHNLSKMDSTMSRPGLQDIHIRRHHLHRKANTDGP